ncbi:MAG: formyl transferase [Henriciella sp.]
MSEQCPIVVLTSGGPQDWIMINALRERFGDFPIVLENEEPSKLFWRRRRKMLGALTVASMKTALFSMKFTKRKSEAVIDKMIADYDLKPEPAEGLNITRVDNINSWATREILRVENPKAVFVASTRLLDRKTLRSVSMPFINYHSGINPAYRGMFGGYFALANREPENFGATVHLIDQGVDTGEILYQSRVQVQPEDNFHTYLWRIAAGSRHIVVKAVQDAINHELRPRKVNLPSNQYFAPTLGGYLWTGMTRKVW